MKIREDLIADFKRWGLAPFVVVDDKSSVERFDPDFARALQAVADAQNLVILYARTHGIEDVVERCSSASN